MLRFALDSMQRFSLRTKLLFLVVPLVVMPLLVVDYMVLRLIQKSGLEQADRHLGNAYEMFQLQLHSHGHRQQETAARLARDPRLLDILASGQEAPALEAALAAWAGERLGEFPFTIRGVGLPGAEEREGARRHGLEISTPRPPRRLLFSSGQPGPHGPFPPPPSLDPSAVTSHLAERDGLLLYTSAWIHSESGTLGVLTLAQPLPDAYFRYHAGRSGTLLAVLREGGVLARAAESFDPERWPPKARAVALAEAERAGHARGLREGRVKVDGRALKLAAQPLPLWQDDPQGRPAALLLGVETERFMQPLFSVQHTIFFVTLASLFVALLLASALINRGILSPVEELLRLTRRVAEGNLECRIPERGGDEIGQLARSFNVMTSRLQQLYGTLEQLVHDRTSALRQSLWEAEESRQMLERSSGLNRALSEFLALLNTIDLSLIMRPGLEMLTRQSQSEAGVLALWQGGRLSVRARVGEGALAESLWDRRQASEAILEEAAAGDGVACRLLHLPAASAPAHLLGFPLRFRDERLGVLCLARPFAYPEEVCVFLSNAARQLGIALSNALAVEQIRLQSEQLERVNRELQRADRLKSEFVANMSHELRTPMNAILGFSRILLDGMAGELQEAQKDKVLRIYERGRDLLNLINSILDLSQIEAGRMRLNLSPVDVGAAVRGAVSTIEALAQRKALRLDLDLPATLPRIQADPVKLDQILLNLLGNAVKFTHKGGIRVAAGAGSVNGHELPRGWVGISVADSGIGISPENQERIFESFTQVDGSDTREYGGTGLGLAITKKLVELHGGRILLESSVNQGTTFTVVLPDAPP